MKNTLLPIVSKNLASNEVARIHQDLTIYLSDLEEGKEVAFSQEDDRRIFLFVIEGELAVNGDTTLSKRDSARITDTPGLQIAAKSNSRFMLIDLP
jgi:quercetin 2,3-dioxygenase